jgi:uncharacterized protein (DUF849 family)
MESVLNDGEAQLSVTRNVIVSCAVTGSIHVPSQSRYLPVTPAEVAASAVAAAHAGATIIHVHARNPIDGRPSGDLAHYEPIVERIRTETNAILNITTGGASTMALDERLAPAEHFSPELCSLNLGSMNFGLYQMVPGIKEFRHEWEREYLESSRGRIFRNTFEDIQVIVDRMGQKGARFEFECYDVGHLYTLLHFLESGVVRPPLFVQTIFGILGGIGVDLEDLAHMKRTADRLFGKDYVWSVLGVGRHQTRLVTTAALMGGNVRVGLEDSIYLAKGVLAQSNADQVAKIARILAELSLGVMVPDEARTVLGIAPLTSRPSADAIQS